MLDACDSRLRRSHHSPVKVISSRLVTPLPDEIILITGLVVSFAMVNNFGDGAAVFPQLSFAHA
jgi:hypothetical protein